MRPTKILLSGLMCCLWVSLSHAQTFNARFSTSVYSWENQFVDSAKSSATSMRAYQSASVTLSDAWLPNLSFHTYVRARHDFSAKTEQNPDYRFYSLYASWHNSEKSGYRVDAKVGRQQILAGLRSPTVDGLRVDYARGQDFAVMGYFGALAPADGGLETLKPYQRRAFGGKISTSTFWQTNASVTYFDKSRETASYYRENIIQQDNLVYRPKIKERFVGFDVNRMFVKKINWFAHAEYNALEKQLQTVSSDIQYRPNNDWFLAVEGVSRKPNLIYNSFFTAFDDLKDNQEVWFRARYRINSLWSVNTDLANVFYSGKDAQRMSLGVGFCRTSLTYMRRSGYGGTMNAVSLASTHALTRKLNAYGSASYVMYKLDDFNITDPLSVQYVAQDKTNTSLTAVGRLSYEVLRSFNVDAEMQFLSQNIKSSMLYAGNKYDARFFLRANYWMFSKL